MDKWKWNADQRFVVSDSWDGSKLLSFEKDKDYGFSWPQRNYKCSFCKKEFKSAQALGGHMNVHRRDRARMRLSSPSLMDSPNPNPNVTSSPSAKVFPYHKAACNDSTLSCVSNAYFSCYADKELYLGPNPNEMFSRDQKVSRKQVDISFENVPLVRDVREICGGDGGKKKKGAMQMHEVAASRKDGRMLKANGVVRLDLSMGCFVGDEIKGQDLDLELRLGYC